MPSPCTGCGSATTSPAKFLLICRQCGHPWHHRCHRPPVSDKELIQIINLFNKARAASNSTAKTLPWTCGACVKGKAPAAAPVASGSATSGAIPAIRAPAASGSGAAAAPAPRSEQAPGPKGAPKAKAPSPIVIDDDSDDDIVVLDNPPPAPARAPTVPAAPPKTPTLLDATSPVPAPGVPGARAPQPQPQPPRASGRPASQIGTKSASRAPASVTSSTSSGSTQGARPPVSLVSGVITPSSPRADRPSASAPARSLSAVSRTLVPALDGLSMQKHSQEPMRVPMHTSPTLEKEEEARAASRYKARTKMHPRKSAARVPARTDYIKEEYDADEDEDEGHAETHTAGSASPAPRTKHHPRKSMRYSMRPHPTSEDEEEDQLDATPAPAAPAIKLEAEPAPRVPAAPPLIPAWIAAHPAPDVPPDAWARAAAHAHSRSGSSAKRPRKAFTVVHRPGGQVEAPGGEGEGKGQGQGAARPFCFAADAWIRAKMVDMK